MAPPTDPTRRLRLLAARSARTAPAQSAPRHAALRPAGGWVPTWPDEEPWPADPAEPADQELGGEPLLGAGGLDEDDGLPALLRTRRRRFPALPHFGRLRQRWIPESLREARVDPGRSGSLVLSVLALVAASVAAIGVWLARPTPQALPPVTVSGAVEQTLSTSAAVPESSDSVLPTTIVVSVTGAVQQPGVVTLPVGSRVADALAAAGGANDGVDLTGLNLAARLADGDSIVVGGESQGLRGQPVAADTASGSASAGVRINLNTADSAALQSLPGVGPVMATNIIAWRDANGPFSTVDQLQEVTGIGPTRFATLAPLVTIQ